MMDTSIIHTQLTVFDTAVASSGVTPSHWTRWMSRTIDELLAENERLSVLVASGENPRDPRERVATTQR